MVFWWFLGIVAGILCLWAYSTAFLKKPVPPRLRKGLFLLRLLFIIALLYLLTGPRLEREIEQIQMAHLAILLDDSESMNLPTEAPDGPTRLEAAKNLLTPDWMQQFSDKQLTVSLWRTSDLAPVRSVEDFQARAGSSPLGQALSGLSDKFRQTRLAGIVLVSDGQNTEGPSPAEIADSLEAPLFNLGLGPEQAEWQVTIEELIVPEQAFQDEIVPIQTVISQRGEKPADAGPLKLSLRIDGRQVAGQELEFATGQLRMQWPYEHRFEETGPKTIQVIIEPEQGPARPIASEVRRAQWRSESVIQILRKKYQAVILSGRPGWEVKFLRRALEEDPRLEATLLWPKPDGSLAVIRQEKIPGEEIEGSGSETGLEALFENPSIDRLRQSLSSVDLLILSDLRMNSRGSSSPMLRGADIQSIGKWVRAGGKLLILGGPEMFASGGSPFAPFESMLPVRLAEREDYRSVPVFLEVTEWGRRSEALTSLVLAGEKALPPAPTWNELGPAKLGTEVLLTNEEESPLLAWHTYGEGRVMAAGPDSFWKLGLPMTGSRIPEDSPGSSVLDNFWRESGRFLILGDRGSGIRLYTDGSRYERGNTIRIWCRVSGNLQVENPEQRLVVEVKHEEERKSPETLFLDQNPLSPTLYEGSFRPQQTGAYLLKTAMNQITDEKKILVTAPRQEYRRLHQDVAQLQKAAAAGGGAYFALPDAGNIPQAVEYEPVTEKVTRSVFLGSSPWILMLLLLFLSSEWILRKQASLP
jgi:hypothetical protein